MNDYVQELKEKEEKEKSLMRKQKETPLLTPKPEQPPPKKKGFFKKFGTKLGSFWGKTKTVSKKGFLGLAKGTKKFAKGVSSEAKNIG